MKVNRLYSYLLLLIFLCLQACGLELAELNLPEGEKKLVVEGGITNLAPPHLIRLSRTSSFKEKAPLAVKDALVILSDEQGRSDTLQHTGEGVYSSSLKGIPDRSYHLLIQLDTAAYTASAFMPKPARLDSFSMEYFGKTAFREEGYYLSLNNLDPGESEGYYRWLVWRNGLLQSNNPVAGHFVTFSVTRDNESLNLQYPAPFQKGDSLLFQTIKMDKAVYTYYQGMLELMMNNGGLLGPLPTNPPSNLSGGALGVFQANSILESAVVIE